jgi:hypothetical protein
MYQYLAKHPELFPAVIGITHTQFKELLTKFSPHLRKAETNKAFSKVRLRTPGGGRKAKYTSDTAKLFLLLFYYKVYPTFRVAQVLFQLDKRNVQLWVRFLEPVVWKTLGYQLELPVVNARYLSDVIQICPALKEFIIDGTERPIRRPKDSNQQEHFYSGKKKFHTVKNQLIVSPRSRKILAVSKTVEGKLHDKKLMEQDLLYSYCPPEAKGLGDSGYQGTDTLCSRLKMVVPIKKPPGTKLTAEQKATNKKLSQIRVRVEHPIAYLKHFNILRHQFRNQLKYAHQPFETLAALYNFTRAYR